MSDWRPVPGLEGVFHASADGRIRSARTGRILRQHTNANGYAYLSTRIGGRKGEAICHRVHRLVARAWVPGETSERNIVHHRNSDRLDNRAANLEWVTASENTQHAYDSGRVSQPHGEDNHRAKLTDAEVAALRRRYHGRPIANARSVAARYGVDHSTLYKAVRGETWRHVPMPEGTTP